MKFSLKFLLFWRLGHTIYKPLHEARYPSSLMEYTSIAPSGSYLFDFAVST